MEFICSIIGYIPDQICILAFNTLDYMVKIHKISIVIN